MNAGSDPLVRNDAVSCFQLVCFGLLHNQSSVFADCVIFSSQLYIGVVEILLKQLGKGLAAAAAFASGAAVLVLPAFAALVAAAADFSR